jgi:hypothetical protein
MCYAVMLNSDVHSLVRVHTCCATLQSPSPDQPAIAQSPGRATQAVEGRLFGGASLCFQDVG